MKRYDVIELISEAPAVHGVFEQPVQETRQVFCEVRSVSRSEWYSAQAQNIQADIVFVLTVDADYENEKELLFHEKKYRVIRTYINDDGIELTCELSRYPDTSNEVIIV